MKLICMVALIFFSSRSFANPSFDCQELKSEQIRLSLTASNLANQNSTRTPEGGAYRPFIINSCANGLCKADRISSPIMKYLPGHPDADQNGYVAFPNIDLKREYAVFNMTATKLKLLASAHACDVAVLVDNSPSSFILQYNGKGQPDVKEDIFNLSANHEVVSWMRQDLKGRTSTLNIRDGAVVSQSLTE